MTRIPTIRLRRDFRRIFEKGRRFRGRRLTAVVAGAGEQGTTRVAYVVSGKVRGAVKRNRIKRRLREAARRLIPSCMRHRDIVLIATPGAEEADYHSIYNELAGLLSSAGLLSNR